MHHLGTVIKTHVSPLAWHRMSQAELAAGRVSILHHSQKWKWRGETLHLCWSWSWRSTQTSETLLMRHTSECFSYFNSVEHWSLFVCLKTNMVDTAREAALTILIKECRLKRGSSRLLRCFPSNYSSKKGIFETSQNLLSLALSDSRWHLWHSLRKRKKQKEAVNESSILEVLT